MELNTQKEPRFGVQSFREEFIELLNEHGIEFNERYLI
jgi:hypothetical protein